LKKYFIVRKFILLQLLFWLIYAAMAIFAFGNGIASVTDAIAGFAMFFVPGFVITTLYRNYFLKYAIDFTSIKKIIPALFFAICIHFFVIIVFQLFYNMLYSTSDLYQGVGFWVFIISVFIIVAIINLPWYFIYHIHQYIMALHKKEIEALQYREENTKLQIESLTNKLNPHFLFNALNTIRWLTGKENTEARNAINNLSEILRYNLTNLGKEFISIKEELDITEKYLLFEKIRFEERLDYSITCPQDICNYPVVPFSILNLVENSIKHGINQLPNGGRVDICILDKDNNIIVEIKNTGKLGTYSDTGFGVESLNRIFKHAYNKDHAVHIENINENEVLATIIIPKQ
jgi:two-component system, LytTR family, sensor kinase